MSKQTVNQIEEIKPYIPVPRKPIETCTPFGNGKIIRADLSFDNQGNKIAKPGQVLDLDAMIQAAKESTDIAAIVARAKSGDESVLNVNPGIIGDATALPKDIYDYKAMNDLYDRVAGSFDNLPEGLKAMFDNDANKYLNAILDNTANSIVSKYKETQNSQESEAINNG